MVKEGYSHLDIMNMWIWQRSLIFYSIVEEKAKQKREQEQQEQ